MSNALELLNEANDLIAKAIDKINQATDENQSLSNYYQYSLEIITQELDKFSSNSEGYSGYNTSLQEVIESEGENWEN